MKFFIIRHIKELYNSVVQTNHTKWETRQDKNTAEIADSWG